MFKGQHLRDDDDGGDWMTRIPEIYTRSSRSRLQFGLDVWRCLLVTARDGDVGTDTLHIPLDLSREPRQVITTRPDVTRITEGDRHLKPSNRPEK